MDAIIARIRALTDADFTDENVGGTTPALRIWGRGRINQDISDWRDLSAGPPLQVGQDGPAPEWRIETVSEYSGGQVISTGHRAVFYHTDGEARELFICVNRTAAGVVEITATARMDDDHGSYYDDDSDSDSEPDDDPPPQPADVEAAGDAIVAANNQYVAALLANPVHLAGLLANPAFLALLHTPGMAAILDGLVAAGINVPPAPHNDEDDH